MQVAVVAIIFFLGISAQKILFLNENDKCREGTNPWYCKRPESCKSLKTHIKKNELQLCGFTGKVPIVCCSNNKTSIDDEYAPNYGLKAKQKCEEYAQYVFRVSKNPILLPGAEPTIHNECVQVAQTLIVGGEPAKLREFPHMALIGIKNGTDIEWFCGGSLISPRFILTAAHCQVSKHIGKAFVRLGDINVDSKEDKARPIEVNIVEVFDHPKYVYPKAYHDISLLKLEKDVKLKPSIRPLCLDTNRTLVNKEAIATGWGHTAYGGNSSNVLKQVRLDIVKDEECKKIYTLDRSKLPRGVISKNILCAGGKIGEDTCQGDSGGPLQVTLHKPYCMFAQIGVTSFGSECGRVIPGGYTRVSYYVPWIESIVWP